MSNTQYHRDISEKVSGLTGHYPAFLLTGARQTGKTTLLRKLFREYRYVTLDVPAEAQLAEQDPAAFFQRWPPPLLVDEVQYAPALFRHLKVAIDQTPEPGRFILTGSQKFTLMQNVTESLAGRVGLLELETLSVHELGADFESYVRNRSLSQALVRGFYPQLWKQPTLESQDFYRSYLSTYIERDVRQLLNIGSLRDFDRFMRVCATRSGQLLNRSALARDVGVANKTINAWLSVLEASNQLALLEPYFANVGKRVVKSPKLYFTDPGLVAFLLGIDGDNFLSSPHLGALWETFVFSELRKSLRLLRPAASLWFYRDTQMEVDFVIATGGKLHLAEAKWHAHPSERDFATMERVAGFLPQVAEHHTVISSNARSYPFGRHRVVSGAALHDFVASETLRSINGS